MSHVLYYPTIEFNDLNVLKRSLLVWNRIFRIVPTGYIPQDRNEIVEAYHNGAIVNLNVDSNEKSEAATKFMDFYNIRNDPHNALVWPAGLSADYFTRLNPDKIDAKLLPLFEQLARRINVDGFYEIPYEIAGGYMFHLAATVAKKRNLDLITDSADCWAVGTYFAQDGLFSENIYDENSNGYLVNLAIEDLLPSNLHNVSIEKILRFNEDNIEQQTQFQKELLSLRQEITKCNNREHARYIVFDFIKRFEKAKSDYKDSLRFLNKADVCSVFSVGIPASATIISMPQVNDLYTPLKLGVGMLIGAVAALANRNLTRSTPTIGSFLVDAENLSKTPNVLLHRKFEEFIND